MRIKLCLIPFPGRTQMGGCGGALYGNGVSRVNTLGLIHTKQRARYKLKRLQILLHLLLLASGCAHTQLFSIRMEDRIPIHVRMRNLTGSPADSLFLDHLRQALAGDYLFITRFDDTFPRSARWVSTVCQNPFRTSTDSDSSWVQALGSLDRAGCVPTVPELIQKVGLNITRAKECSHLRAPTRNPHMVALCYRFVIASGRRHREGEIVFCVARQADSTTISEEEILETTAGDAATIFLSDLADLLAKRGSARVHRWRYATLTEQEGRGRFETWLERGEE
jgi:hypothetical protein